MVAVPVVAAPRRICILAAKKGDKGGKGGKGAKKSALADLLKKKVRRARGQAQCRRWRVQGCRVDATPRPSSHTPVAPIRVRA